MLLLSFMLFFIFLWVIIYPLNDLWVRYFAPAVIKEGITTGPKICLTFDDGPNPDITPFVLDILAKMQVPATFFLVGARAELAPKLVKQIQDSGHEIGLHTYYHQHAYVMFIKRSLATILKGKRILEAITEKQVIWFRPPWGALNLFQYLLLKFLKLRVVLWNANANDWDLRTGSGEIIKHLQNKVRAGSIIVIHDAGGDPGAPENMLKALPKIIESLKMKGYQFVTLNDMAGEE